MWGGADDDLLIGGYINDPGSGLDDENVAALEVLVGEWTSERTFEERIGNLNGTAPGPHPNFPYYLITSGPDQTCFADTQEDRLIGNAGNDWLIGDAFDVFKSGERMDEI